jgi:hypothetical protein
LAKLNVTDSQVSGSEVFIHSQEMLDKLSGCDGHKTRVSILQSAEVHGIDFIDKLLLEGGINIVVELPKAKVFFVSAEEAWIWAVVAPAGTTGAAPGL